MRKSIQFGLGVALTGGLLMGGCGDWRSWTHLPGDEGPGSSGPDAGNGGCKPPRHGSSGFDYNGDGFADFLLDDRVVLGGPNGYQRSFALVGPMTPVDGTSYFPAGDLNGDRFSDLMRFDRSNAQTPMGIYSPTPLYGSHDGFTAGTATSTSQPYGAIYHSGAAGDVNGDGYGDFVFKTRYSALTYLGAPATITEGPAPAAETSQSDLTFGGDYDGDGYADAASMSNNVPDLVVTRGSAVGFDPSATTIIMPPAFPTIGALATVDANGDRYADLAVGMAEGQLAIFLGSPQGLGAMPAQVIQLTAACQTCAYMEPIGTGDFNGDRMPDLVTNEGVGGTTPGGYAVHTGAAGGFNPSGTPLMLPAEAYVTEQSISDVNGDGFEDLTAGLRDTTTNPDGSLSVRTTRFSLLLGSPSGLTAAPAM